jgi:hypothetical protein
MARSYGAEMLTQLCRRLVLVAASMFGAAVPSFAQVPHGALPPEVTVPAAGVTLPILAMSPNPIVEVRVNGRGPFRFMLDTGGQGYARADVSLAKALSLPVLGQVRGGDGSSQGVAMDVVGIDTLDLGGATFKNVEAPSRDYNAGRPGGRIDGVLGLHLFAGHLLTIDFPNREIRIAPGTLPEPDGQRILGYDKTRGVVSLPIRVGAATIDADIDTGSMAGLMLPSAMASTLPLVAPPVVSGQARTISNTVAVSSAVLQGSAHIGAWQLDSPALEFSDLFRRANVGAQVLREFALTIDQQQHRIRLDRASTAPIQLHTPRRAGVGGPPTPRGLLVDVLVPGGAAEKAGLQRGDVITHIGERAFADIPGDQMGAALTGAARVTLKVLRGDKTIELTLVYTA